MRGAQSGDAICRKSSAVFASLVSRERSFLRTSCRCSLTDVSCRCDGPVTQEQR